MTSDLASAEAETQTASQVDTAKAHTAKAHTAKADTAVVATQADTQRASTLTTDHNLAKTLATNTTLAKEFTEIAIATPHVEELDPLKEAPKKTYNFYDYTLEELGDLLKGMGKEKFRAQQVFKWVYEKRVENYDEMSNVSKTFRAELPEIFHFDLPKIVQELKSKDGTRKWLFDIGDGMTIETVLIPNKDRLTLCVSSEVGCNIACRFCFTGKQKLKRRLSAGQIVGQFLHAQDSLKKDGLRVTNIVFMGMGEPLDNADAVFKSIEILHQENGINLSRKKITVSTSGLVPQMHRIAKAKVRLAVSLNAPNNEIRSFVMPINKKYDVYQLLDECRTYYATTGDRITFEYVLLKGVTDKIEQAKELWELVRDIPCKINLIPFNEHPGSGFERPEQEQVKAFQNEMIRLGAHVLLRKTMGRDIFAACGQLTSKYEGRPDTMSVSAGLNSASGGPAIGKLSDAGGRPPSLRAATPSALNAKPAMSESIAKAIEATFGPNSAVTPKLHAAPINARRDSLEPQT